MYKYWASQTSVPGIGVRVISSDTVTWYGRWNISHILYIGYTCLYRQSLIENFGMGRPHKKVKVTGRKSFLSKLMQPLESGNNSATLPIEVRGDTDSVFLLTSEIYVRFYFMSPLSASVLFYYVLLFEERKHVASFCLCTPVRTAAIITLFGSVRHYILKKAQVNTFWCIYSGSIHMN